MATNLIPPAVIEAVAHAAYEAHRAFAILGGDTSLAPWDQAEEWQRASARVGAGHAAYGTSPRENYEDWVAQKRAEGWVYGPTADAAKRTHPALVPFDEFPPQDRARGSMFHAVARAAFATLRAGL